MELSPGQSSFLGSSSFTGSQTNWWDSLTGPPHLISVHGLHRIGGGRCLQYLGPKLFPSYPEVTGVPFFGGVQTEAGQPSVREALIGFSPLSKGLDLKA